MSDALPRRRKLERSAEGVPLVVNDGKYLHDPPRPATAFEIEMWDALVRARAQLSKFGFKGSKQVGRALLTMEEVLGAERETADV